MVQIFSNDITLVRKEFKRAGDLLAATFYFKRIVVGGHTPIEISFIYDGILKSFCKQLDTIHLTEFENEIYFKNDIVFNRETLFEAMRNSTQVQIVNNKEIFTSLFGIKIEPNIEGFTFEKTLFLDSFPINSGRGNSYGEGYLFVFEDSLVGKLKKGFFIGNVVPFSMKEFEDKVNSYGKSKILSDIEISQKGKKTIISNNSPFEIKLNVGSYKFNRHVDIHSVTSYKYESLNDLELILQPGDDIKLDTEYTQKEEIVSLLDRELVIPKKEIIQGTSEYENNFYVVTKNPFEIELLEVLIPSQRVEPDSYIAISQFVDIEDLAETNLSILNKDSNLENIELTSTSGKLTIIDEVKVKNIIVDGQASVFSTGIDLTFKTKMKRIFSYLGEDEADYLVEYANKLTSKRVIAIERKVIYNDVISSPIDTFSVEIGMFGNIDRMLQKAKSVVYKDEINEEKLPCKKVAKDFLKRLLTVSYKDQGKIRFSANDILEHSSKKVCDVPVSQTGNKELDDAYSQFNSTINKSVSGFRMVNVSNYISSEDVATVEPLLTMREDESKECREDFVYKIEENLAELGLSYSVEHALAQLRKATHFFKRKEEVVATVSFGLSIDKKWYFCGEDFELAENVENPKVSTFAEGKIIEKAISKEPGKILLTENKKFLDSNDWGEHYKQELHDMYKALVTGTIEDSSSATHSGIRYFVEHTIDANKKLTLSYKDIKDNFAETMYLSEKNEIKTKILFPNIFDMMVKQGKIGDGSFIEETNMHTFGKLQKEYYQNYRDLQIKDAYDSAYEVGHSVYVRTNSNVLKQSVSLFATQGTELFGLEIKTDMPEKISIHQRENVIANGEKFAYGLEILLNNERISLITYDYLSKKATIELSENVKIADYSFLLFSLDMLVNNYYDTLEGKERSSLGVYDFFNSQGRFTKSYLFSSKENINSPSMVLKGVALTAFGVMRYLSKGEQSSVNDCEFKWIGDTISVKYNGLTLISFKECQLLGKNKVAMIANGVRIEPLVSKLFLPVEFRERKLQQCLLLQGGFAKGLLFGDVHLFRGKYYLLSSDGLERWEIHKGLLLNHEVLISLEEIFDIIDQNGNASLPDGLVVEFK